MDEHQQEQQPGPAAQLEQIQALIMTVAENQQQQQVLINQHMAAPAPLPVESTNTDFQERWGAQIQASSSLDFLTGNIPVDPTDPESFEHIFEQRLFSICFSS